MDGAAPAGVEDTLGWDEGAEQGGVVWADGVDLCVVPTGVGGDKSEPAAGRAAGTQAVADGGFQSPAEAQAELGLGSAEMAKIETEPGGRGVDRVVALNVRRMVYEPDIPDPEEKFVAAVSLAENSCFQEALRNLFDWEDALYADGWTPEEVEKELPGLEEAYRDAVREANKHMAVRAVTTLLPGAAGWAVTALRGTRISRRRCRSRCRWWEESLVRRCGRRSCQGQHWG
jgi:hypothetical protein